MMSGIPKILTSSSNLCPVTKLYNLLYLLVFNCSSTDTEARMGKGEGCTGLWWGNLRERDQWGDPDADGMIILRWISRKWEGLVGTGWSWLRIETGGGQL